MSWSIKEKVYFAWRPSR